MEILLRQVPKGKPMSRPDPPPYTQESIQRALDYRRGERLRIAREMGIPGDLVDLFQVFGPEKVQEWVKVLVLVSAD